MPVTIVTIWPLYIITKSVEFTFSIETLQVNPLPIEYMGW